MGYQKKVECNGGRGFNYGAKKAQMEDVIECIIRESKREKRNCQQQENGGRENGDGRRKVRN